LTNITVLDSGNQLLASEYWDRHLNVHASHHGFNSRASAEPVRHDNAFVIPFSSENIMNEVFAVTAKSPVDFVVSDGMLAKARS
jgi:hypothetical protein